MEDLFNSARFALFMWLTTKRVFNNDHDGSLIINLKGGQAITIRANGSNVGVLPEVDHYSYVVSSPAGSITGQGATPELAFFDALRIAGKNG